VQVHVFDGDRMVSVRPSSVEVVNPGTREPCLPPCPADLQEAARRGVLHKEWYQPGGSWADMEARLESLIAGLVAAGWTVTARDRDVSWEHGDSVIFDLERYGETIELESFGDGRLTAWPMDNDRPDEDDGGESSEPLWRIDASDANRADERFRSSGWL
jgi:hypothetical protein